MKLTILLSTAFFITNLIMGCTTIKQLKHGESLSLENEAFIYKMLYLKNGRTQEIISAKTDSDSLRCISRRLINRQRLDTEYAYHFSEVDSILSRDRLYGIKKKIYYWRTDLRRNSSDCCFIW